MNQIGLERSARWSCSLGTSWLGGWGGAWETWMGGHWISWGRLRDSPELKVWIRKRNRSADGRTDGQTEFPPVDSTTVRSRVKELTSTCQSPCFQHRRQRFHKFPCSIFEVWRIINNIINNLLYFFQNQRLMKKVTSLTKYFCLLLLQLLNNESW